jgi:short-subunit dehydrogenase
MVVESITKKTAWAVVTGGNSGLGREIATQLAKKGYKIILATR